MTYFFFLESRIYAEDPFKNFGMPSIGRLHGYKEPSGIDGVRCDSGIEEGSEISMYYDPMICKLTAYGKDRDAAIKTSIDALDNYVIRGVTHNIPLLRDILDEPTFLSGTFTTNYLNEVYPEGFKGANVSAQELNHLLSTAAAFYVQDQQRLQDKSSSSPKSWSLIVKSGEVEKHLQVSVDANGNYKMNFADEGTEINLGADFSLWDQIATTKADSNAEHTLQLIKRDFNDIFRIRFKGTALNVQVIPEHVAKYRKFMKEKPKLDESKIIIAPMPGTVKSVSVEVGQMIGEGAECCVLEAMKMQNSLKIGSTGKVKAVHVKPGATVQADQVLVELE